MYCKILMSTVRFEFRLLLYGIVNKKTQKNDMFWLFWQLENRKQRRVDNTSKVNTGNAKNELTKHKFQTFDSCKCPCENCWFQIKPQSPASDNRSIKILTS